MGLKSDKNYVTANAVDVILMQPKKKIIQEFDYSKKKDYGKVPKYISKLKDHVENEYKSIRELHLRNKEEESKKTYHLFRFYFNKFDDYF